MMSVPLILVLVFIIAILGVLNMVRQDRQRKTKMEKERQELVNVSGAGNGWSCDEILFRLYKLKLCRDRQRVEDLGFIENLFSDVIPALSNTKALDEINDAIFKLERIAARYGCTDDNTSSDTIIGYSNE